MDYAGGTELSGYFQTWNLPGRDELPILRVPGGYTDLIIAFVAPDSDGVLRFTGPNVPTRQEIGLVQERGVNVLISIGGGSVEVNLDTEEKSRRFSESLLEIMNRYATDGIDIDVENGMPAPASPLKPEGTMRGLIEGLDRVFAELPEKTMLTMAPETLNLAGGFVNYGGAWGNYLPLIMHFSNRLTQVHMQYYNSGQMKGLDGRFYDAGTVEFALAMTDLIIAGFEIAGTGVWFEGLPPEKVSIGLPAVPEAAVNGYLDAEQVRLLNRTLRSGVRFEGQFGAPAYGRAIGYMTWSVQWDAENNFAFMKNIQRL